MTNNHQEQQMTMYFEVVAGLYNNYAQSTPKKLI